MSKIRVNERRGLPRGGYDIPLKDKEQKWKKNLLEPFTEPFDTPHDDINTPILKKDSERVNEWIEITEDVISEDLAVWFGKNKKRKVHLNLKVLGLISVKRKKVVDILLVVEKILIRVGILFVENRGCAGKMVSLKKDLHVVEREKRKKGPTDRERSKTYEN